MRIRSFDWDGADAPALAERIRALQSPLGEVRETVASVIAGVRERGDDAVAEFEARFGAAGVDPHTLPIPVAEARASLERIDPELRGALETAADNIRAVADAQLANERRVELAQGQAVELREVPVGSAAVYAPG